MESKSCRFFFDDLESATTGLLLVLLDARVTDSFYRFGGLDAQQLVDSGLWLSGEIDEIADKLEDVPGATKYEE